MTKHRHTKRSILLDGRKTSVSLEDPFFDFLAAEARRRGITFGALVAEIHASDPQAINLSSSLRIHALKLATGGVR